MNFYKILVRPWLFEVDPERAHELVGQAGAWIEQQPLGGALLEQLFTYKHPSLRVKVAGIPFENPLGLAAGFDKTGKLYPFLSRMGFGHVECGTFTYHAQIGNDRPRIFRYPDQEALINRMGFNNPGAQAAALTFISQTLRAVRGINIGKSKITPLDAASTDYVFSLRTLAHHAEYITINVSSPNTPELRQLQEKPRLIGLLKTIRAETHRPIFLKISPDLAIPMLEEVLEVAGNYCHGLIVSNTTIGRGYLPYGHPGRMVEGGLSGPPLTAQSYWMLKYCYNQFKGRMPIISVGGISSAYDAIKRILAGASLVQIYTSYIYEGPGLPKHILQGIAQYCEENQTTVAQMIGAEAEI